MEPSGHATTAPIVRRRLDLRGRVQGVGLRPYAYRLAVEFALGGFVGNDASGAFIEVEGPAFRVEAFERALTGRLPPLAQVSQLQRTDLRPRGQRAFSIRRSRSGRQRRAEVAPDAATCPDCLRELFDPADRRYRYPFINCTNCGPRYSIIRSVPYDRPATTMAEFTLCRACAREYAEPAERRFHAQPNACPACGPRLELCRPDRTPLAGDPLARAARLLAAGRIVAVKGVGGYHLACRADWAPAVRRLRERKLRDGKPLAVMAPDPAAAGRICRLSPGDIKALTSPAAPIVLAPKAAGHGLAAAVAPNCPNFGVMLPYAPVHHLLFAGGLGPLVMTSANLAGQPLTYRDQDAFARLADVAEAFLTHNRRILRPIDDSVVFTFRGRTIAVRRARGYAPQPLRLSIGRRGAAGRPPAGAGREVLALGGELKSTVCLYAAGQAILSEHLGDLKRPETYRHFLAAIERLQALFDLRPRLVAHDLHPQYLSTQYARGLGLPRVAVQHHHAHLASVMAEHGHAGPLVGLACDGAGHGSDGAVWGCELLHCAGAGFVRLGHLEYFPLVGGDLAALETWRPAAALLRQAGGRTWRRTLARLAARWTLPLPERQLDLFERQALAGLNAPPASSLGRVFDAASFLLGLCAHNRHEAEAAMALEAAAADQRAEPFGFRVAERAAGIRISLLPCIVELAAAAERALPVGRLAARFHETVARALAAAAVRACARSGVGTVALSGGCFANRRLLGRVVELLESGGLDVLYNVQVPCGDGGVSLGQAFVAAWAAAGGAPLRQPAEE